MKLAWLLLLIAPFARATESNDLDAVDVLKTDGVLLICDGSSYFSFNSDGVFRSFPRGMSGRSFDGVWQKTQDNPLRVEAVAKVGWINGIQPRDDYRKIVLIIYSGRKRAVERSEIAASQYKQVFEGYFIVDELSSIAGPIK